MKYKEEFKKLSPEKRAAIINKIINVNGTRSPRLRDEHRILYGHKINPFYPKYLFEIAVTLFKTIVLVVALAACSSEEDPAPAARLSPPEELATGCNITRGVNDHKNGIEVTLRAELSGCIDNVVLYVDTRSASGSTLSSYRKPAECEETELSISFAAKGEKLYLGLFPCGGTGAGAGRAYKMYITQGTTTSLVESKIGNTIQYIAQ